MPQPSKEPAADPSPTIEADPPAAAEKKDVDAAPSDEADNAGPQSGGARTPPAELTQSLDSSYSSPSSPASSRGSTGHMKGAKRLKSRSGSVVFNSLHKHDGRGFSVLRVLFRRHGSVVPAVLPVSLFSAVLVVILAAVEQYEVVPKSYLPILKHPIAVQMVGIVLGYVVVLRANVAVQRYFEAISNVQFFGSKWLDAYSQLCGFIRTSARVHKREKPGASIEVVESLQNLTLALLHWFSLLHGLAINSLQITQLDLEEQAFFDRVRVIPLPTVTADPEKSDSIVERPSLQLNAKNLLRQHSTRVKDTGEGVKDRQAKAKQNRATLGSLVVLGPMSAAEKEALINAESKVDLVHSWIIEAITEASLDKELLTHAPILSRVYQELSNGMLGYNQAYKIALVQFPFAFAQMLTLFLFCWAFCCPIAVYVFTGGELLTPSLTLMLVMGYWGIHEISLEVENPFGVTANCLPLKPLHDSVCEALHEAAVCKMPGTWRGGEPGQKGGPLWQGE